ncbi:MAG: PDDEXK nuclease domain-containing protein [Clostridia bacterium]
MDLEKKDNNSIIIKYQNTDNVVEDICSIIESARDYAYQSVNIALVERNWFIGYRIAEEELKGENRANYGTEILKKLSKELKKEYGKGFELRNLYYFLQFYKTFPNILHSVNAKSNMLLSWTHYKTLLQVPDEKAREWYEKETAEQTWSVRTLQRNISSQYYYRLLKSQVKEPVIEEMKEKNKEHYLVDKLEFVKNPLIAEFLGFSLEDSYTETELETSIINNVFYNYILKCFVLIDLKTNKVTHQDIGQMDMYVRMYDELKKAKDDNPTIGILLCTDTDADVARYSVLHGNEQLFATKYKTYLPTEEQLKAEIESQKAIFEIQQHEKKESNEE